MALLRRKKKDAVLPEVDKYYDGERRDRTGLAWLLALVSVLLIVLVIIGLFLFGRWIYREATDNDDNGGDTAQVENGDQEAPSFDGTPAPGTDESESDGSENDGENGEQSGDTDSEDGDDSEDDSEGTVDAPAHTDTPSTGTPVTGDEPLPNTGPANLVGVFAGVSTLVGGAHYVVTRKKQN